VIKVMAHIEKCLWGASPACSEVFNGKMSCGASGDPRDQEQKHAMMDETAQQLHEQYTQSGTPSLALMDRIISERMMPMDFKVTKEAAGFATEAHIHHMCTVANLIRACCFEGLAYSLVTSLGPERFTEWKAALIDEAAGELPRLFGTLERDVRNGKFEPGAGALTTAWPCHPRI
jgi:hypothetical protein